MRWRSSTLLALCVASACLGRALASENDTACLPRLPYTQLCSGALSDTSPALSTATLLFSDLVPKMRQPRLSVVRFRPTFRSLIAFRPCILPGHGACMNSTCVCEDPWTSKSFFYDQGDCVSSKLALQIIHLLTYASGIVCSCVCCWRVVTLKKYLGAGARSSSRGTTRARKHIIRITFSSLVVSLSTNLI